MFETAKKHWPEYLIEMTCLGTFMVTACTFASLLGYPQSPAQMWIAAGMTRRVVMGLAMGITAIALIYSPWGRRSGAHMNPAITLTYWRLGKVRSLDAMFYMLSQFAGGIVGVLIARVFLDTWLLDPAVNYAVTTPGRYGTSAAFAAETIISFILMSVILTISNTPSLARYTGLFAGSLVAIYITFEAPISGMSMNAARTLGSGLSARVWTGLWIYFTAPLLGMMFAAEVYAGLFGRRSVICAKLHHDNTQPCIFNCGYAAKASASRSDTTDDAHLTCNELARGGTTHMSPLVQKEN